MSRRHELHRLRSTCKHLKRRCGQLAQENRRLRETALGAEPDELAAEQVQRKAAPACMARPDSAPAAAKLPQQSGPRPHATCHFRREHMHELHGRAGLQTRRQLEVLLAQKAELAEERLQLALDNERLQVLLGYSLAARRPAGLALHDPSHAGASNAGSAGSWPSPPASPPSPLPGVCRPCAHPTKCPPIRTRPPTAGAVPRGPDYRASAAGCVALQVCVCVCLGA